MDFLSQETWKFLNTFAPWLSAVGTISAVITSLYLSRKDRIVNLEIMADCRFIGQIGDNQIFNSTDDSQDDGVPDALVVYITNIGHREAVVDRIFWKWGIFNKKYAFQNIMKNVWTSELPKRIKDGEIAHYCFPKSSEYGWVKNNGVQFVGRFPWLESFFIKVIVKTSIGKDFEARIGPLARRMIVEEARKRA